MKKDKKSKNILFLLILIAIAVFAVNMPFSIYQPGGEAPIEAEITLDRFKAVQGETVNAGLEGEWWNRSYSYFGGANIAGYWFLDGKLLQEMDGQQKTVSTTYCFGSNPSIGCVTELKWDWKTLPVLAELSSADGRTQFTKSLAIDTTELEAGPHVLEARVFMLNGPTEVGLFECGNPMGACCPNQTQSQGFPCAGIFGVSQKRDRQSSNRCQAVSIPAINPSKTFFRFSAEDFDTCGAAGSWCCQQGSSGSDYDCYTWQGSRYVTCGDWEGYSVWGSWGEWATTVEKTEEQARSQAVSGSVAIASAAFEIVVGCPFECCEGQEGYLDKECGAGGYCVENQCVAEPEPPPKPIWQAIIDSIISWIQSIFDYFFAITGPTVVEPGQTYTYELSVSASLPDSDYSDGTMQFQYGNWALVDSSGSVKDSGEWEQVLGAYEKSVSVTVPLDPANYAVVAVIQEYDMEYDFEAGSWKVVNERVVAKQGIDITTSVPAPQPPVPVFETLLGIIQGIINWVLGLLGLGG